MIKLEDVIDNEDDDYMALEKLTQRIDQLATMARKKYKHNQAKVHFITRAIISAQLGLSALQITPNEPSYQRLINELYTSMREQGAHKFKNPS